jgi:N-acetylglucosamine-6-phosphate deacetylase
MGNRTPFRLINCTIYTGNDKWMDGSLTVGSDGKIARIGDADSGLDSAADSNCTDLNVIDLQGAIIVPGFVDVHVHGGGGYDILRGDAEDFAGTARFHARHGTTSFLPSTGSASHEHTLKVLANARAAMAERREDGAEPLGIHLEGPYINPIRKGAMDESVLRLPDLTEMQRYIEASGGHIRLVTMAPELPGGEAFVRAMIDSSIRVSIGHSDASYEEVVAAAEWGATHTTHHYNGMRPLHHRDPGVAGAGLMLPGLTTELICDGVHVHPAAVKFTFEVKGEWNVCAITDAVAYAGMPDGEYGESVVLGGEIYLKGTRTLAGSCATMLDSLKKVLAYTGRPLEQVLPSFTAVPAREAGAGDRKGSLEPGKDADFLILDNEKSLRLLGTYIRGKAVYVNDVLA